MSLQKWLAEKRLRRHECTAQEIGDLFKLIDRDIADSSIQALSEDRRFVTSYNAVLQLATIILRVAGYRTAGTGHHWLTFQALPELMGEKLRVHADYFDWCRTKRNMADYDAAGVIGAADATELYQESIAFRGEVIHWLMHHAPGLLPPGIEQKI